MHRTVPFNLLPLHAHHRPRLVRLYILPFNLQSVILACLLIMCCASILINEVGTNGNAYTESECDYMDPEAECGCDLSALKLWCKISSEEGLARAFASILNRTLIFYWHEIEIICLSSMKPISPPHETIPVGPGHPATIVEVDYNTLWPLRVYRTWFEEGPVFEKVQVSGNCTWKSPFLKGLEHTLHSLSFTGIGQVIHHYELALVSESEQPMILSNLERVSLTNCLLEDYTIPRYFGRQPRFNFAMGTRIVPRVKVLKITRSSIKEVEPLAFATFPTLEILDLSNNRLTSLSREAISENPFLKVMNLERNSMRYLSPDFFDGLQFLTIVVLRHNQLTTIPPIPLNTINNRHQELKLAGNMWDCRCRMSWLLTKVQGGRRWLDAPLCSAPESVRYRPLIEGLESISELFC